MTTVNPPAVFSAVLERLQFDAATYYRQPSVRLVPSRYEERPFSHVLRIDVHNGTGESADGCLFAKIFKADPDRLEMMRQRVTEDYRTTRAVHDGLQSHHDLGVVPPVACYPDLLAIVTEEVKGVTLLDHLARRAAWWHRAGHDDVEKVMESVGRWIRVFQQTGASVPNGSPEEVHAYVDHRLKRLVGFRRGFDEAARAEVLRTVDALCRATESADWAQRRVHSDMALGNIMVADSGIVVLDFAMAKVGNYLQDVSRVYVQLDLLRAKPFIRRDAVRAAKRGLLRGFDPALTDDRPMFRLMALRHRINHMVGLMDGDHTFAVRMYNSLVVRRHYQWLADAMTQVRSSAAQAR